MAFDPIIECLRRITDYARYEQFCADLMRFDGYFGIEPLGGTADKSRDSVLMRNSEQVIFHYNVRKDWRAKLWEDAKGVREHGHSCTKIVCVNPAEFSATERDECIQSFRQEYGWTLELYGMQRMATLLRTNAAPLLAKYPQIFVPDLIQENRSAQIDIRVNSTRDKRLQLAQITGYNRGPGPVLIESWHASWKEDGVEHATHGMTCYRGSLPVRLEEKDKLDIMVPLDFNWETLERIGLCDAEHRRYDAPAENLQSFIATARLHAPPPRKNADDELTIEQVQSQAVTLKAIAERGPGQKHDRLVLVFRNDGEIPLTTGEATIEWKFDTERQFAANSHLPGIKVVESEGSLSLSRMTNNYNSSKGSEVRFLLHDDMAAALAQLITRESEIVEVKVAVQVAPKYSVSETENVREVAISVAQSVIDSWG